MIPLPPFSVKLDILDVAYVTYLVPAERLRPAVPEKIAFAMTHEGKAFVSLVMFHNRNVRASLFPFIRFNYDQLNVRTYIIDPVTGKTAVLFLHSGITSGVMSFGTKLLGIPWPVISLGINGGQQNSQTGYTVAGEWGGRNCHYAARDPGTRQLRPLSEYERGDRVPYKTDGRLLQRSGRRDSLRGAAYVRDAPRRQRHIRQVSHA